LPVVRVGREKLKNIKAPVEIFAVDLPYLFVPPKGIKYGPFRKFRSFPEGLLTLVTSVALVTLIYILFFRSQDGWLMKKLSSRINQFTTEKIAVLPLKNNTMDESLEDIGRMASYWITKGLTETSDAKVVSYQSVTSNAPYEFSTLTDRLSFSKMTGAVNAVEGHFLQDGDSLIFQIWVKNLNSGEIVTSFQDWKCAISDPLSAIRDMENRIKGYWASRNDRTSVVPNYDAYKLFIKAKDLWQPDYETAISYLEQSIELDSSFSDSYFLLTDIFINILEYTKAKNVIKSLEKRKPDLGVREQNLLNFYIADLSGDLIRSFQYFTYEYELDPKDLLRRKKVYLRK